MTLLKTKLPIIQAPMAGVQDSELAIAVCNAGGLGSLPCGMLNAEQIVNEVQKIKAATDHPFNLNFFCHTLPDYNEQQHQRWQQTLAGYFSELGGHCESKPGSASRQPFSHEIADAIESYQPEIISFHFGLPDDALLARVKSWNTKIIACATTVAEAQWLEEKGVDAIIAQGLEAGGHRGMFLSNDISTQVGTMALLPQIINRVKTPVIASGGISDAAGVKAAMDLGAAAVQIGTAYMLCDEAKTTARHRQAIQSDRAQHTALTNIFSGRPARGIVNRIMKDLHYMAIDAPEFPYAAIEVTQLRALAEAQNCDDFSPLWCGQNSDGCAEISAAAMTKKLAAKLDS